MSRRRWSLVAVLAAGATLAAAGAGAGAGAEQDQQPTFRAVTSLVPVQVSVKSGRSFVAGLGAADFELYDNGVRQQIDVVSADAQAADVTLIVDTSGSVVRSIGRFRSGVRKIAELLRPGEAIRLITFDTDVRESSPMADPRQLRVDDMRTGNMTSLVDAITFGLARARRPDRHHLVFVFSDGYDNASVLGYGALPEIAGRSDAVLYVVLVKVTGVPDEPPPAAFDALAEAAVRTGGDFYPPGDQPTDVAEAFRQALASFRHAYVIYFRPQGVTPSGWHDVTVKVTRPGTYAVQARRGYYGR